MSLSMGAGPSIINPSLAHEWVLEHHAAPCGAGVPVSVIRELREQRRLTLKETARLLAEAAGRRVTVRRLTDWESGEAAIPLKLIPALMTVFDAPFVRFAVAAARTACQRSHRTKRRPT